MPRKTLWDSDRMAGDAAIQMTADSLRAYGPAHPHWAVAWSGGKDSTALVTLVTWLIESGSVPRPETYTVLYADTRLELLPLWLAAKQVAARLCDYGVDVRTVMAPVDKRMLVYILGRGVPPPNNRTLRWCTRQTKVDPMTAELRRLVGEKTGKVLMLTGVRVGESAARDERIAVSCGRDGAECGQGWYQETLPGSLCDTLAPLLHWRVCHVWDWLKLLAPSQRFGSWPTQLLAEAYGGDEAVESHARTGCIGCPLASRDLALDALLSMPDWGYLLPLKRLRSLWWELREPQYRLRKPAGERRQDGSLVRNQHRMGPLTLEARQWALHEVLAIQSEVNTSADRLGRPGIDLLNKEEEARVRELITFGTWPDGWTGNEPQADEPFAEMFADGSVQALLFESEPSD